ncbi:unnamed protein product [Coregonus sp. 'balchen']|nr:unnamed protein product [Coregonus sp. 'balchen']
MLLRLDLLSLLALSPSLAAPHRGSLPGVDSPHSGPRARSSRNNKLLLISFDGFRWDYDRDVDTPHLDTMGRGGVNAAYVTPPYLTITSPTHFTLLTGERVKVSQVEPPFYEHNNETDWRINIDKVIGQWFSEEDLDFVSLYFGEPDTTGHKYGPDSPERREMVRQVDRTVGYIRDTTGITASPIGSTSSSLLITELPRCSGMAWSTRSSCPRFRDLTSGISSSNWWIMDQQECFFPERECWRRCTRP